MKFIRKNLLLGFLIGLALNVILFMLVWGEMGADDPELWKDMGYTMVYSIALTLINGMFFNYLNNKVQWGSLHPYRVLIGAVGGIILTMTGFILLLWVMEMVFEGKSWEDIKNTDRSIQFIIALLIVVLVSALFHAFYFYKHWQESKVKEQKIIAGTASAKFDALKNQLDPHFLFNSLNVLTSLIEEDPAQAQKFTTSLSKVYRYVLEQKNKDLVTVDEELQFARTYVELLRMRFEDSIQLNLPGQSSMPEARIVPLSLQLLLENAVKHNLVSPERPLKITVEEKDGMLVVSNNLQEKQVVRKSSGVGLRNIQQRYSILSDRQVEILKTTRNFTVQLPLLTRKLAPQPSQQEFLEVKRYQKARDRVEKIKSFYGNLTAYFLVIPFLAWLNYRTTSFPWALFPAFGWGFGLLMHGLEAYGYNPLWGKRWEERKIRELMEKDNF